MASSISAYSTSSAWQTGALACTAQVVKEWVLFLVDGTDIFRFWVGRYCGAFRYLDEYPDEVV